MNEYAVKKLASNRRRTRSARRAQRTVSPETGVVDIHIIGVVGDSRFRTVRQPIDPIMFRNVNQARLGDRPLQRRSATFARARAAMEADHQRGALQRQV
jgi:putative ABC transport system permease protein